MKRASRDFRFLFFSLVLMSLASPLLGPMAKQYAVLEVTFTVVLISAVLNSIRHRLHLTISLVTGGLALAAMLASRFSPNGLLNSGQALLVAAFLGYTAYLVLTAVLRGNEITSQEVYGALSVYLMLGFMWEFFYLLCLHADPAAIHFPHLQNLSASDPVVQPRVMDALTYYSFTTLTTLGYGDIVPVSRMARTLAWMEAACGQLFLAVLVARLVGLLKSDQAEKQAS